MFNNKTKQTAKQQALKDIAAECKEQRKSGQMAINYAGHHTWYSHVFRAMSQPGQLIIDFN